MGKPKQRTASYRSMEQGYNVELTSNLQLNQPQTSRHEEYQKIET